MSGTFTIPVPVQTEVDVAFCPLLREAFELWEAENYRTSLEVLEKAAPLVGAVSLELAGKFHNQYGLALVGLNEYGRAVREYESAVRYFETYGSSSLLAIVKNNLGWVYLQLRQFAQAHECINDALLLVDRDDLRAQFYDTQTQIFLAEGKSQSALVANDKALALLAETKKALADCLASRAKIKHGKRLQNSSIESSITTPLNHFSQSAKPGGSMVTALDCAREIINGAHESAPALFSLIVAVADPDGDPVRYSLAWELLRLINGFTPEGERHLREEIQQADASV